MAIRRTAVETDVHNKRLLLAIVCILTLHSECLTLPAGNSQCPLGPDYYTLNGTNSCLPCSVCDRGQGVLSPCSENEDAICRDCGEGTYSKITSLGRVCYPCTMCAQEGKSEVSPCSPTEDSTCGECASGFFLYIDSGGSECKVCSQCPQDKVVIHWIECAEAGLPLDMQCAPEETNNISVPTTTALQTDTVSLTLPANTIPLDRGGFINQSTAGPLTTETPASEIGIIVSVVSLVFTLTTIIIFFLAFGYVGCCYLELCKKHRGWYQRLQSSQQSTDLRFGEHHSSSVII